VSKPERDIAQLKSGQNASMVYQSVTGVAVRKDNSDGDSEEDDETTEDEGEGGDAEEEDEDDEGESGAFKDSHRPRDESPNSRKVDTRDFTTRL
jgi:hypothetical protein